MSKKIYKSIFVVIVSLSNICNFIYPSFALEKEYKIPKEEFVILKKKAYDYMIEKYEGNNNKRSSSDYEYKYEPVETVITNLSAYKNADGQPLGGTMWSTKGSGFYWKDSSYSPGTFSLGVSFSTKIVTVGLSFQPGTISNSSTSYFTSISSNQVNKYVKLQVARKYSVTHYQVYRKIRTEKKWTYIRDEYPSVPYSQSFKVVNV